MIAQGKSDMAIVFNTSASWAYNGKVAFDKPIKEVRGLVGGLDNYFQAIVVRKGLDIGSLADIKKREVPVRLFTTRPSGAGETGARLTLAAYGINYDNIKKFGGSVEHTSHGAIIAAFKDGRADIFMHCITKGHPSTTEISVNTAVKFLSVSDATIKEMQGYGYTDTTMPNGLFRGQDDAVRLPGITSNIIVNKNMKDSLAYTITKSICENKAALVKGHPAFGPFDPKQAWRLELVGVPLHPGAEKYYKEKGWMK
jgi:TRAP transporter TAXI family solute receptor